MNKKIKLTVNGITRTVELEGWERLIDVLRLKLRLTGTKRGCDDFACGACTVIVNGKARKSCTVKAEKLDGAVVDTVEGLAKGTELHPIQQAMIEARAIQCGFCTPGIEMELKALFDQGPCSEEKILKILNRHLCRCTGYEAILEGALKAQEALGAVKMEPNKN